MKDSAKDYSGEVAGDATKPVEIGRMAVGEVDWECAKGFLDGSTRMVGD